MSSNWKAKTLTLAVLSIGILFQPFANAYDSDAFPGKGKVEDFRRSFQISKFAIRLEEQGKTEESIKKFKEAIAIYPHAAVFHYNLGVCYSELRNFRTALDCYKNAIRLAPDYAIAHANISDIHFKLGEFKAAEQTALVATQLDKKDPVSWLNLAQAEIALQKAALAKQHLQLAKALPNADKYSADFQELNSKLQRSYPKTAEN